MKLEDQLRTEMAHVPAEMPAGVARTAYQRYRRRRARTRAVAAAATAAVAAIGVVAGIAGGHPAPGSPPRSGSTETAYVVDHVTRALGTVSPDAVVFVRQTYQPATAALSPAEQWTEGGSSRQEAFTLSGAPEWDNGTYYTNGQLTAVEADYQNRTWFETSQKMPRTSLTPPPPVEVCQQGQVPRCSSTGQPCSDASFNTTDWSPPALAAQIRAEQACGMLKVVGHSYVDGVYTVKLTGTASKITQTYWINQSTYLPVRLETSWGPVGPHSTVSVADVQYLPPTKANLALLKVHIPAGFKRVPHQF
jgi:hypothetical protein